MIKRKILIVAAIVTTLVVPFSVFAATSDSSTAKSIRGFFGIDTSKLTEKQKSDVKDYSQKLTQLQKDFINDMVENGSMTKEQSDDAIKKMEEAAKNAEAKGFIPGFGGGKGPGGPGVHERGGFGMEKIDTSKLTDQQKTDIVNIYKKMAAQQKDDVSKMVSNGLLTKDQGDNATKKIDEMLKDIQDNGFSKGMGMIMGGFGGPRYFGIVRMDTSKLTDKQKADMTNAADKMTALQKELINKLVASSAMTKDQGDTAIKRIDEMLAFQKENGFQGGFEMKRRGFGGPRGGHDGFEGQGMRGGFNPDSSAAAPT